MRIDLNPATTSGLDRSSSSSSPAATRGTQDMVEPLGRSATDVASLSTGSDAVQQLKAQLSNVPDVRQRRVDSLRQAIGDGTFQVSPASIAEAMLARA